MGTTIEDRAQRELDAMGIALDAANAELAKIRGQRDAAIATAEHLRHMPPPRIFIVHDGDGGVRYVATTAARGVFGALALRGDLPGGWTKIEEIQPLGFADE